MMPTLLAAVICLLALAGNAALWITFLNRSHGLGIWRPIINGCTLLSGLGLLLGPLAVGLGVLAWMPEWLTLLPTSIAATAADVLRTRWSIALVAYTMLSAAMAFAFFVGWRRRCHAGTSPAQLLRCQTSLLHVALDDCGTSRLHRLGHLARLPRNEVFSVEVVEKTLTVTRLPQALDGLSIAHLSDLHMSGRIGPGFFRDIVEKTNDLAPDLVAVTGDIVDSAKCLDWLPETLGKLRARHGVYFILGNHDRRVSLPALRTVLGRAGLVDLGGRTERLMIDGAQILLAGNELPWIHPAATVDRARALDDDGHVIPEFRLLLSHSPDQIRWARERDFDLMLAGHTHGGQVRFPIVGAVLAPSIYGTKYACGTFYEAPTLMHVSRGVSGLTPLRYGCAPELALLRLVATRATPRTSVAVETETEAFATWT